MIFSIVFALTGGVDSAKTVGERQNDQVGCVVAFPGCAVEEWWDG